jgi:hypothetical protein
MSTVTRRQRLESQRVQLQTLLASIPQNRKLERLGFESQLEEVEDELAALGAPIRVKHAETDLVFHGAPVVDSEGIDAAFAGDVISSYQDLVTKVHASRESVLLGSGPVRDEHLSHLHVTGVIHGSFGFQLREIASTEPSQTSMFTETPLFSAVEMAAELVDAAGKDDDAFVDLAQDLHPRVHEATRRFFDVVRKSGASFSLSTSTRSMEFGHERIGAAAERVSVTFQDENERRILGTFLGVLGGSRTFEHRTDQETIRGKAEPHLDIQKILDWHFKTCVAVVRVKRWQRAGRELRRYTLLRIDAPDGQ